jgi:hypothetical protein
MNRVAYESKGTHLAPLVLVYVAIVMNGACNATNPVAPTPGHPRRR